MSVDGASNNARACASLSAGVLPSWLSTLGRRTPFTGLWVTALALHKYSYRDAKAASLRRMVEPASCWFSRSLRQARTWLRVTRRKSWGWVMPALSMNERISFSYARRVCALLMLANHWASAGTSCRRWNCGSVRVRLSNGATAVIMKGRKYPLAAKRGCGLRGYDCKAVLGWCGSILFYY